MITFPIKIYRQEPYFVHPQSTVHNIEIRPTEDCNLRCSFCFEKDHHDVMDRSRLEKIFQLTSQVILQSPKQELHLVYHGGEMLQDKFSDSTFIEDLPWLTESLQSLCTKLGKTYVTHLCSNLIHTKLDRYIDFLKKYDILLTASYDPFGRFSNDKQKRLFIDNVKAYSKVGLKPTIQLVLTKGNIEAFKTDPYFKELYELDINFVLEHYLQTDWNDHSDLSEQDYFEFLKSSYLHYPKLIDELLHKNTNTCCATLITSRSIRWCCSTNNQIKEFFKNKQCHQCKWYNFCGINHCISIRGKYEGCGVKKFYNWLEDTQSFVFEEI